MTIEVGAVLLAAGFSNRFGSIKICAGLASGQTVFQQTLSNLQSAVSRVLVVTRPEVRPLIETDQAEILVFNEPERGMGATLAYGIAAVQARHDWSGCLICLADMPFISAATYRAVAETVTENTIVVPSYQGKPGNPTGFGRNFYSALSELTGDRGGRSLVRDHPAAVTRLAVDDPAILQDIDTPDDLMKFDHPHRRS